MQAVPEHPGVGDSASNGFVERGVQLVEDQIRTLKHAFEIRTRRRLPVQHPLMHWICLYAGNLLNKYHVNSTTGQTAYAFTHGRDPDEKLVEFGETVLYHIPAQLRKKLDLKWLPRIYLGRALSSD